MALRSWILGSKVMGECNAVTSEVLSADFPGDGIVAVACEVRMPSSLGWDCGPCQVMPFIMSRADFSVV